MGTYTEVLGPVAVPAQDLKAMRLSQSKTPGAGVRLCAILVPVVVDVIEIKEHRLGDPTARARTSEKSEDSDAHGGLGLPSVPVPAVGTFLDSGTEQGIVLHELALGALFHP